MAKNKTLPLNLDVGLYIRPHVREAIIQHMSQCYPSEACGLLFGREGIGDEFVSMENIADNPEARYAMSPEEQLKVFKAMRERGMDLVAIVHSHIDTAAYPSPTDIAAVSYPEADYLIMAVYHGEVVAGRSFRIKGSRITERRVIFREPTQS